MSTQIEIIIRGPAKTGKSTLAVAIAKGLAQELPGVEVKVDDLDGTAARMVARGTYAQLRAKFHGRPPAIVIKEEQVMRTLPGGIEAFADGSTRVHYFETGPYTGQHIPQTMRGGHWRNDPPYDK